MKFIFIYSLNSLKFFKDSTLNEDLNLENFDESLENVDINSVVVKHAKFIKNNLKFESSNELGVIANGWVRTRK